MEVILGLIVIILLEIVLQIHNRLKAKDQQGKDWLKRKK